MLLLAHKLELGLMVFLLRFEHQDWLFTSAVFEHHNGLFTSALTDFSRMRPQEVLLVFWDPALDENVVGILYLVSAILRELMGRIASLPDQIHSQFYIG